MPTGHQLPKAGGERLPRAELAFRRAGDGLGWVLVVGGPRNHSGYESG